MASCGVHCIARAVHGLLLVRIAEGKKSLELTSHLAPDPASVTVVQVIFLACFF